MRTRWEKTDCGLYCSKQTLRQPRNGVTDWSILQLLTDHWLVCGGDARDKNSHASQLTANNYETSGNIIIACKLKHLRISYRRKLAVNFLKGKEFKAILLDLKKESCLYLFIHVYIVLTNSFKIRGKIVV